MDKTTLVDSDIEKGRKIIEFLNESHFPIHYALWLYSTDKYDEWRFVISTSIYDDEGPLSAYKKLDDILRPRGTEWVLWSERIQLVGANDAVIRSLEKDYPPKNLSAIRSISGSTSDNTYIEQAYLYPIQIDSNV
jgi:hypothetical protein